MAVVEEERARIGALATKVTAPLVAECYANFECRLSDTSLVQRYSLFIFEVVKAHVAASPKYPTTLHYRGDGVFMVSGKNVSYRRLFKPENLSHGGRARPLTCPSERSLPSGA